MKAKRVLIVVPQLWTGGVQKMNLDLAAHIHDPRVEVVILSLYPRSGSLFDEQAERYGVQVKYLNKHSGVDLSIIRQINHVIAEFKPDVLHVNQRMTIYVLLPMLWHRIRKRMYVVHSLADHDAHGITRSINKFAFHHLHMMPVAISETCRKSISDVYGMPESKIHLIYNGVDLQRFQRREPYEKLGDDTFVFMTTCSFRREKNLPLLVSAFASVHRRVPNTRLIMLGDGEMMSTIREQVRQLNLEDCVDLPGSIDDTPSWLNKAHIYVMSSDWEGLPVSVLEAMGVGLPVVATKAGGVVDIVKEGLNGYLVNTGDCDALANRMEALACDRATRLAFSKAALEEVKQYSLEHCVEEYIKFYVE